jgi:hypothetical protein
VSKESKTAARDYGFANQQYCISSRVFQPESSHSTLQKFDGNDTQADFYEPQESDKSWQESATN